MDWDKRLVMMDKRMMLETVKSTELPHKDPDNLTLSDGTLAVGQCDRFGWRAENECVVLINPDHLTVDKHIRKFPALTEPWEHENHGIHAKVTEGAMVVTCRDTVNIYTPGITPKLLHSIQVDLPITKMDCSGGDIAVGMLDGTITIWPTSK